MGAINLETNAYEHTMRRAISEGADLNEWMGCADAWCSRLSLRAASFCTERSGHFDAIDQGMSFFLPNMTFVSFARVVGAPCFGSYLSLATLCAHRLNKPTSSCSRRDGYTR